MSVQDRFAFLSAVVTVVAQLVTVVIVDMERALDIRNIREKKKTAFLFLLIYGVYLVCQMFGTWSASNCQA